MAQIEGRPTGRSFVAGATSGEGRRVLELGAWRYCEVKRGFCLTKKAIPKGLEKKKKIF